MREKLTCIYRGHNFEDIAGVVSSLCERITDEPSLDNLQKLCGALSYASLFVIPDFDLTAGKAYTVENSCYYVDGMIKLSYHAIVENLYELTAKRVNIPDALIKILLDCAFGEVMSILRLPMSTVFVALLRCYCDLAKLPFNYDINESWYRIQLSFSEEVGYLAN